MADLRNQTITSIKWTTTQNITVALLGPVLQIIKARFLNPEDFAYLAIIMIVISFTQLVENMGISQAIIQRDNITSEQYSSLFFLNVIIGVLLVIGVYFSSPFLARIFKLPLLDNFLKLTCLVILISSPSLLFRAVMQKRLKFKELSIVRILREIFLFVFTFIFLLQGKAVYGVLGAYIISAGISTLFIWIIYWRSEGVKIRFHYRTKEVIPFLKFGLLVSSKQLLTFFAHRFDEILIGYFFSAEILGIYHFGKNLLEKLRNLLTSSFASVLFPVFSRVKNDFKRFARAYQKVTKLMAFIAFPIFAFIAITAETFVPLIFGDQWTESVIVFQVFSVNMIFLVLTANIATSALYAMNKPGLVLKIDILTNAVYFAGLILFASKGLIAVMVIYSLYVIIKTVVLQIYANKSMKTNLSEYFSAFKENVVLTLLMVVVVFLWQYLSNMILDEWLVFAGSVILGIVSYFIASRFIAPRTLKELFKAIKNK